MRVWITAFTLVVLCSGLAGAAEQRALLDLRINEAKKGSINVIIRGDDVLARLADLEQIGLRVISGRYVPVGETKYVSLKSLTPTIKFRLDVIDLSLRLTTVIPPIVEVIKNSSAIEPAPETQTIAPQQTLTSIPTETATQPMKDALTPSATMPGSPAKDQVAFLDLRVNLLKKNVLPVILRSDDVLVRVTDLQTVGVIGFEGVREEIRGDQYVSLRSLAPQVSYRVNDHDLSLDLTVNPKLLGLTLIDHVNDRPSRIEYRQDTSSFLNYSFIVDNFKSVSAFSEAGLNINNTLLYTSVGRNTDGSIVRGLSNLTVSNRETLNRTTIGDRLLATDTLGGSLTLSGIGYYREFALDPYFTRSPGLHYGGAVATPSTLDVYVNGQFLRRIQLPPGQFELKDLPVPTGSADTRLVLRDAFGREQEFLAPFYFTSGLLQKGLHEFSYNFGAPRKNLGTENWDYEAPVFVGRHRMGFTDKLTGGFRLEASPKLISGGPTFSFLVPYGEMEFSTAASQQQGSTGGAAYLGYSWNGPLFNFGSSVRAMSPHYSNSSLKSDERRTWLQTNAALGFNIADRIGVNLRYTIENTENIGATHRFEVFSSLQLIKSLSLFVRGGYNREPNKNSMEISTGLNFQMGDILATVSHERIDGVGANILNLQKTTPIDTGFGYRFTGKQGDGGFATDSQLQYQSSFGLYDAIYTFNDGVHGSQLRAAGGVAFLGGNFFFTRPLQESFALIRVPDLPNIRGYTNNLEIGRTDSNGNLLVPNLLPYYGNKLRISDRDIPLNYNLDGVEYVVATPYRGGAIVTFPVTKIQRLMGTIALERNGTTTIPMHGQLTVNVDGKTFESPIGRRGEFYFENVPAGHHKAIVTHNDDSCAFQFTVPDSTESDLKLGDLKCTLP